MSSRDSMEARRSVEDRIAHIAARQYGVISRAQLLAAGVPPDTIRWRVRARRMQALHRGVYRVGPLTPARALEMAAVLACGAGAVISHWSSAVLRQLCAIRGTDSPVEVTVTGGHRGRRPGVRMHRAGRLPDDEVTELDGIPITTVARTLLDVSANASSGELSRMLAVASRTCADLPGELQALLARYPRRRGAALLRSLIAEEVPALTRSEAEEQLLRLIRKSGMQRPEVNAHIEHYEVDFLWRTQRLIVEVDGFAYHASRDRFENDRRRDAMLAARGFRVMRMTWRQITTEPEATLLRLAEALWLPGATRQT